MYFSASHSIVSIWSHIYPDLEDWIQHSLAAINGCILLTDALQNQEEEHTSHVWIA